MGLRAGATDLSARCGGEGLVSGWNRMEKVPGRPDPFRPANGEINPGESRVVAVNGQEVAIFNVEGQLYAVGNKCPHRGGPLSRGRVESGPGPSVRCPIHGWLFDLKTGRCLNQRGISIPTFCVIESSLMNLPTQLPEEAKRIVEKIVQGYAPQKIYLYGSYAWGRPDEESDLDLLVVKETPLRRIDREVEVATHFSNPQRRVPVDLIVLTPSELEQRTRRGDPFLREILENGKLLYAA